MRSGSVVIVNMHLNHAIQMALAEDHLVIKALEIRRRGNHLSGG
jgi:hypothetical protein